MAEHHVRGVVSFAALAYYHPAVARSTSAINQSIQFHRVLRGPAKLQNRMQDQERKIGAALKTAQRVTTITLPKKKARSSCHRNSKPRCLWL
jgi:hypothetical protein